MKFAFESSANIFARLNDCACVYVWAMWCVFLCADDIAKNIIGIENVKNGKNGLASSTITNENETDEGPAHTRTAQYTHTEKLNRYKNRINKRKKTEQIAKLIT